MITTRGKRTKQGAEVERRIADINERFPTPGKTVALWYIEAEYTAMTAVGPEYGHFVNNQDAPTIFVATQDRTAEQIAGQIAFQYAMYLQHEFGWIPNSIDAKFFAKYTAEKKWTTENQPFALVSAYQHKFGDMAEEGGITI